MPSSSDFNLTHYWGMLAKLLGKASLIERDKTGGYICIANGSTGLPLNVSICGSVNDNNAQDDFKFSQGGAKRLAEHQNHHLSWQSRSPQSWEFGGAVRCENLIYSFEGYSEAMNEALMLYFGIQTGRLSGGAASALAQISKNEKWRALQDAMVGRV